MFNRLGGTLLKYLFSKSFNAELKQCYHQTHYDTLGLPRNCSTKQIKEAFIKLSKRYHPDKTTGGSHGKFVKVLEAYSVLSKPESRRIYDWQLVHGSNRYLDDFYTQQAQSQQSSRSGGYSYDDPTFWANRDKSEDKYYNKNDDSYYGFPGIKRVSNGAIALLCVVFTSIGVTLQYLAIRHSMTLKREVMAQKSLENEAILAQIREEANENGTELQIELMEQRLLQQEETKPNNSEMQIERRLLKDRFYKQFREEK